MDKGKSIEENEMINELGIEKYKEVVDAGLMGAEQCYKFGLPCKHAFRFYENPEKAGCKKCWGYNVEKCPIGNHFPWDAKNC